MIYIIPPTKSSKIPPQQSPNMTSEKEQDQQDVQPSAAAAAAATAEGEQQQQQQQQASSPAEATTPTTPEENKEAAAVNQASSPAQQQESGSSPQQRQPRAAAVHKADFEKDVVYLYQFPRTATGPMFSPFCLKVETWLRITDTKFENVDHRMKFKSKKGKLPFVEFNGGEIADSTIIIKELSKCFEKDLDASLTSEQRTLSHALCIMLDHHTGWVFRWWIYNHPGDCLKSFKVNGQHMLNSKMPTALLNFIIKMKMKGQRKAALAHGLGVHSPEVIFEFGKKDLTNLHDLLGDKDFFFGDEPTLLDVVAFSHLVPILGVTCGKFLFKTFVEEECPRLVQLVERIKERYWDDWAKMCETLGLNTHLPEEEKKQQKDEKKEQDKEKENKEKENGGEKEKSGSGTPDEKESSEPEKEKIEKDEKEKEKDEEDTNKAKEAEEKTEDNKKE